MKINEVLITCRCTDVLFLVFYDLFRSFHSSNYIHFWNWDIRHWYSSPSFQLLLLEHNHWLLPHHDKNTFQCFCLHLIIRLLQKVLWSNRNMLYTDLHMLFLLVSWISQSKLDTLNSLLIEINFPSWQIKGHEWTTLVNLERYFLIIMDRKHVWMEGAVIGRFRWGSLFVKQLIAIHISSCYWQYIYSRPKKWKILISYFVWLKFIYVICKI